LLDGSELNDNFVGSDFFFGVKSQFIFDLEKIRVDVVDFALDFSYFFAEIFFLAFFYEECFLGLIKLLFL
jgi:hypothetical protein